MKFSLKNVNTTFKKLSRQLEAELRENGVSVTARLVADLRAATPIDTGEARSSWSTTSTIRGQNVINSAEHIARLNEGSSKQAPSHFIEATALKYGTPSGVIVQTF